ncbi:MAG: methyltransferase domain-containing protein [Clostridiales bacterium]|jgi:16S rRNA (cytosine967-C5)-methyltransferase|nr:methyltransferase domain-containing protein [Clostridiales bacterium]
MKTLLDAYKLLNEIIRNKAYANIALDKAVAPPAVRRIVLGVLEKNFELDARLNSLIKTSPGGAVRLILKLGAYCILYMDSMPVYAVINESVELSKSLGKGGTAGFVNAVLKKFAADGRRTEACDDTVKYGKPKWIIDAIKAEYPAAEAEKILSAESDGRVHFRFNGFAYDDFAGYAEAAADSTPGGRAASDKDKKALIEIAFLRSKGISAERTLVGGFAAGHTAALKPLFNAGIITFQSPSSMLAVLAADIFPGARILDVCAAPGGKAVFAAELAGKYGSVVACDIRAHRVKLIKSYASRMRCSDKIDIREADAAAFNPEFEKNFDFVFADVPCSGLGVMREKADIVLNKQADDIESLSRLQYAILCNASRCVKPGGILLYSTCTLLNRENGATIRKFLAENKDFSSVPAAFDTESLPVSEISAPQSARTAGTSEPAAKSGNAPFALQILPENGYDGFFIARLRRAL